MSLKHKKSNSTASHHREKEARPQPSSKKARTNEANLRLDVDRSILTEIGWRSTFSRDVDRVQWVLFRDHFWANSSVDVSARQTLDLSQWKPALQLLYSSRYKLYVRQEYVDFFDPLIDASKLTLSLRVIMGSPGIGKRVFLLYILIRRLIAAQPTVLVLGDVPILFRSDGTYRLINATDEHDPLHVINSETPSMRPWILVDSSMTSTLPEPRLTNTSYGFLVLASSSDKQCYKSLVKYGANACVWVMNVWDKQELMAVVTPLLASGAGAEARISSLIEQYGPCIRDILKVICASNSITQPRDHALGTMDNVNTLLKIIANANQAPPTHVFHQLFVIRRVGSVLLDDHPYAVDVKSRTVFVTLMRTHLRLSLSSAMCISAWAYHGGIESNSLAVWAFDKIVGHYLSSGPDSNRYRGLCAEMTVLANSHLFHSAWDTAEDELVVSSGSVRVETSNDHPQKSISPKHDLPLSLRDITYYYELPNQFLNDKYYIPVQKNNPLFDAFFVSGDIGKSIVWVVQTTMAAQHGGSEDGYSIVEAIRERIGGECAVKYVLVVPWRKQRAYRWEMPKGWEGHWGEVCIQYIDMDALLRFD